MDSLSRSVIAVQDVSPDPRRAQALSDLMAWCGEGELTPNQVHACLRLDPAAQRPGANGLLLRTPESGHFLATAWSVLSHSDDPAMSVWQQDTMSPDLPDPDAPQELIEAGVRPVFLTTRIVFDQASFRAPDGADWYPAASFPHLDMAVVRIDHPTADLRLALERAGFAFAETGLLADQPSRDGADIHVVGSTPEGPGSRTRGPGLVGSTPAGHVTGLNDALSFFWTDTEMPSLRKAAPVLEQGRIIGFLSPQAHAAGSVDPGGTIPPSFATIVKAGFLKVLIAAHQEAYGR